MFQGIGMGMQRNIVLALLSLLVAACAGPGSPLTKNGVAYVTPKAKAHHDGRHFRNTGRFTPSPGGRWTDLALDPYRRTAKLPANHVLAPPLARKSLSLSRNHPVAVTWIGHSTFLIRAGGKWLLTDPVFSNYATPIPPIGPKRLIPPGLEIEDLPPIDAILLSHNHYDHTDFPSLAKLAKRNPKSRVFIPLGNARTVRQAGFTDIVEADWFEENNLGKLAVTALPAIHSSQRGLFDENRALWGGWSLNTGRRKIYFAGDSAAGSFIHQIRKRLGVHQIAVVPIGGYTPRHVEKGEHATPEEAVALARAVGASDIIPMHWGTFALTGEPIVEQRDRFLAAPTPKAEKHLLRIGETIGLPRRSPAGS